VADILKDSFYVAQDVNWNLQMGVGARVTNSTPFMMDSYGGEYRSQTTVKFDFLNTELIESTAVGRNSFQWGGVRISPSVGQSNFKDMEQVHSTR
jgi:hypothetical protein